MTVKVRADYARRCGFLAAMLRLDRRIDNPYRDAGEVRTGGIVWHVEAAEHWDLGYDSYVSEMKESEEGLRGIYG